MSYSPSVKSARSLLTSYQNGELFTLLQGQPVSTSVTGKLSHVNITSDASVAGILGVAATNILSLASGPVMDAGRLENITTAFNVGDAIYINTDGTLTNIRPNIGVGSFVAGDYMVFVGVIVVNQYNPSYKDLKLYMTVIGQL